jgi:hypothetical protein
MRAEEAPAVASWRAAAAGWRAAGLPAETTRWNAGVFRNPNPAAGPPGRENQRSSRFGGPTDKLPVAEQGEGERNHVRDDFE